MGMQFRLRRKVGIVTWSSGGFATLDLPRGYDFESIFLRLSGTLNTGATAPTAVRPEAPCGLVSRVEVTADGKTQLFSAPFWYTSLGNFDRPVRQSGARATTPMSGFTASTAYSFEAIGSIDMATVDGVRPKDSNFRTAGLSLLQIRFTFGATSDIYRGTVSTVTYTTTPTVEVWTSEMVEIPDAGGALPAIPFLKKVSYQDIAYPTSSSNSEQRLPAGNLIRSVLIRTEGASNANEPELGILNNARLQSGVDVRSDLSANQLRAQNNLDYGQLQLGYYVIDCIALSSGGGRLAELFDVTRAAEPKVVLDVTGATNARVQLVTTEYIPAQ